LRIFRKRVFQQPPDFATPIRKRLVPAYLPNQFPVKGQHPGSPNADTVALKRIDSNTIQSIMKKDGQVVTTVTSAVSEDGTTRTSTFKGKNAKGQDANDIFAYNKQ
jgi:hypothetical protein